MLILQKAYKKLVFYFILIVICNQCNKLRSKEMLNNSPCNTQTPMTVFVHGTLFPLISTLVHMLDCPLGLVPARVQGNKFLMGRIPYILSQANSAIFPLDDFYLFGWSGSLSFDARRKAAYELYCSLKNVKKPITIIAHSHGCNVVLNLAEIVEKEKDAFFTIDRLILFACPVQEATERYSKASLFKCIYSLYSTGDIIQIADPQGLYSKFYFEKKNALKTPLFSQRIFKPAPHITQARILMNQRNPAHIDFILKPFLKKIPAIISLLEKIPNYIENKHVVVNIPHDPQKPYLIPKHSVLDP